MLAWGIASFLSKNMSCAQMRLCLKPADWSRFILGIFRHFCRETRFQRKWRPTEHLMTLMHVYYDIPYSFLSSMGMIWQMSWEETRQLRWTLSEIAGFQTCIWYIYHDQYRSGKKNIHYYISDLLPYSFPRGGLGFPRTDSGCHGCRFLE
jgi:hypothetical protein